MSKLAPALERQAAYRAACTVEVVAVQPIHHGTPEFPELEKPGETVKLEPGLAKLLLEAGAVLKPKDKAVADIPAVQAAAEEEKKP